MATYFHGNSDMQAADGLQTLVLMNPSYVQYSDTPPPQQSSGNLLFLNSAASSMNPQNIPHAPPQPQTQQFVGIPLQASQDPNAQSMHGQHDIQALHGFAPRVGYNLWNSVDPNAAACETPRSQQGLSLSLSSQQPGYRSQGQAGGMSTEDMRVSGGSSSSASGVTNGISTMQSVLMSSKYLKAAQDLLDEVVNVGGCGGVKSEGLKKVNSQLKGVGESSAAAGGVEASGGGESSGKRAVELSTAERQEIQMKKAKLISMLDEVEQRYRHYHHQMQMVISSFEQAAGIGSAKTYTALALKTISKQFRCLKDAIMGQIRAANKSLGEEDSLGGKFEGSRLKFVDHHLRQQRALQQLGMIQQNAWRPQRGLPERAVSVLRAWLFEHFLHPYPKDSDKIMLAKQTGLSRSQVSNWFINARVRLWKPMVEEMYTEEMKEQEQNGSEDKTTKNEQREDSASNHTQQEKSNANEQAKVFNSKRENASNQHNSAISTSMISTSPVGGSVRNQSGFSLIGSSELEGIAQGSPKKQRSFDMLQSPNSVPSLGMDVKSLEANNEQVSLKYDDDRQSRDGYSMIGGPANFTGGFGQYPIGELQRFDTEQFTPRFSGNNVSLTLGLPHCENLSLSGAHQTFLPNQNVPMARRVEMAEPNDFGTMNSSAPHSAAAFDNIDIQNRKRFAAQLLPDFVA